MFKILKKYFFEHFSLIVIILGAISFFASNILMKEILSPIAYGHLSVFITYFSLIYVFGILGLEQVFLRFSKSEFKNIIETQKTQLLLILPTILIAATLSTIFLKGYYSNFRIPNSLLFFSSVSMIGSMFLVTILRLNSNFVFSQLIANGWKIGMFILSILFFFFQIATVTTFVNSIALLVIFIFVIALFYSLKSIKIRFNNTFSNRNLLESSFHFFISISSFSLLLFTDRFIVERKFSIEQFGNFYYLCNFFLAPFSILQNYIGFKQLIYFKSNFNANFLKSFSQKVILWGLGLAVVLTFGVVFLEYFKLLSFDFEKYVSVILLLLIMGIVRIYSSSISAAFEAQTTIQTLRKSNLVILIVTVLILASTFIWINSIEMILAGMIVIWVSRSLIQRNLLLKQ